MKLGQYLCCLVAASTSVLSMHFALAQTDTSSSSSGSGGGSGNGPVGYSKCADVGGTCAVTGGSGMVVFGGNGHWAYKYVGSGKSVACTVAAFGGDPGGNPNACFAQN
ncbi:MAG TPA: hypothetical protein VFW00_04990 [Rhodocyclaceae bacterium]|nr:hypothetical protein [Rhodocyclaceae bacterium]